jgi:uncharacterized protein
MSALVRHFSIALTFLVFAFTPPLNAKDAKPAEQRLPTMTLSAGGQTIKAEVAANDAQREKGLMFRTQMGKNDGMLFVFPQLGYHAMWMRNTLIPLSVAYMDESGKILSIHEMEPKTETPHQAAGPARYALEMNAKWFAQHKVVAGDTIKGLEKAPKPE